jgi:hypothetical protein
VPFFILIANEEGVKPSATAMNAGGFRPAAGTSDRNQPPPAGMKSACFVTLKNTTGLTFTDKIAFQAFRELNLQNFYSVGRFTSRRFSFMRLTQEYILYFVA